MSPLILIDGSGYIFRAYHALPPLTSPNGTPVGAVMGFLNMLLKLREERKGASLLVVLDAARSTFRNTLYSEYKAHRPPPPEDLVPQFALVRDAVDALCLARVEAPDYEADDLIASYAKAARHAGREVVIISSDKDLMQLIQPGVAMHDPMKNKPITEAEVREKFGVAPNRVRDVLALIGDTSDNVPGVPGIGPKTAAELIGAHGSLKGLFENLAAIKQPKRREALEVNREKAELSYALVDLKDDVPLPLPLDGLKPCEPDNARLLDFALTHGFKSIAARLGGKQEAVPQEVAAPSKPVASSYELVTDMAVLDRWIKQAEAAGRVAIDTETTGLDAMVAELVGVCLSVEAGKAAYVPLAHMSAGGNDLFSKAEKLPGQLPMEEVLSRLKPLLEAPHVLKIGHNIKFDMEILNRYGVGVTPCDDTMLISYALSAGAHGQGMDELAERYLQHKTITYDEVTGTGKSRISFAQVPLDKALAYAAEDADITLRLWENLKPRLRTENLLNFYEATERRMPDVAAAMEMRGVRVDVERLRGLSQDFAVRQAALEKEIYALAGFEFNVGSPKQLGEVLFERLSLPGGKKSAKTGAYATDVQVLEELSEAGHTKPAKVNERRQLSKLSSTYTESLPNQVNPRTGRVHTNYSLASTSTGRLSSSEPNLQNIPIRTEEGRKIRTAFIAAEGCTLLAADYSQIELRLLAHVADISVLKDAFRNNDDIHAITASQMFGVPVGEVSGELRRRAKTINFGIIYGISAHGLAVRLGIGRAEAGQYIDQYFKQYPGIRAYMEAAKAEARANGYVMTALGRRCYIAGINDKNPARRQGAERQAINAPLQGAAADIIKRAMIAVEDGLKLSPLKTRMLLQVHDELIFESPQGEEEAALALIKPAMEHAAHLSVPLLVETGRGSNWGEAH